MFFIFKKKTITVDCFTYSQSAYELYKIRKASVYFPNSIRNLDSKIEWQDPATNVTVPLATIKHCTGINSLYKHGAIIPFWMDFVADPVRALHGQSRIGTPDPWMLNTMGQHLREQYPGILENYVQVKFSGVWALTAPKGLEFLWQGAFWNLNNSIENFLIPPAVTYFDTQSQTNLNIFIKRNAEPFTIFAGTPMVHLIPLTDKKVEYKCHLVDKEEFGRKETIPLDYPHIGEGLRNNKWRKDKEISDKLDKQERKCPFGY